MPEINSPQPFLHFIFFLSSHFVGLIYEMRLLPRSLHFGAQHFPTLIFLISKANPHTHTHTLGNLEKIRREEAEELTASPQDSAKLFINAETFQIHSAFLEQQPANRRQRRRRRPRGSKARL